MLYIEAALPDAAHAEFFDRYGWLASVQAASTPHELRQCLAALEEGIKVCAFKTVLTEA